MNSDESMMSWIHDESMMSWIYEEPMMSWIYEESMMSQVHEESWKTMPLTVYEHNNSIAKYNILRSTICMPPATI